MSDHLHRQRTLWLTTMLHAFTHIYQVVLIPLYLRIQEDFKLESEGQATFLVTAFSIAYFLPSYPMGILADRLSRKKLLGYGLAINALGLIGLAFAHTYSQAVACVILSGLGGNFYHPPATALIVQLFPEGPGKALGKAAIGASLGFFIGPLYAGWRADHAGWRQPVMELGAAGLIAAGIFLWLAKEHGHAPKEHGTKTDHVPEKLFATPRLWIIFLVMSLIFCLRDFAGSGMATLCSLFLQHVHGFDTERTGFTVGCIYAASAISNPIFGHLSDRGRIRWASSLLLIAAAGIFVFPHLSAKWTLPELAVYGFFFMASYPVVEAALMESVHPSVRGRVFGVFITIGGLLGNFSHGLIGGWVMKLENVKTSAVGYLWIFNTLGLFVLLSMIALYFLHLLRKREIEIGAIPPESSPSTQSTAP